MEPLAGLGKRIPAEALQFGSKSKSSLANNLPFEKQFLVCPLALAETKHLTMDYEVIVESKIPTMLSDAPNH